MAYIKKTWKDYPDATTPILAEDLNNIEDGLEEVDALLTTTSTNVNNGWIALTGTFTYSSADSPTFVMTTSVDLTGIVGLGMRIKLTQATTKYFIVTAITSSSITMYGGTDYTLTSASISNVYYSMLKTPYGFPIKYSQEIYSTTEQVVGMWIDGKPIYRKVITGVHNDGEVLISNVSSLITAYGQADNGTNVLRNIPWIEIYENKTYAITVYFNFISNSIVLGSTSADVPSLTSSTTKIIIEYTKTTD